MKMNHLEIKKFRDNNNLTQKELAKITGVSIRAVQSWEQNQRNITQGAIKLIEAYTKNNENINEPIERYKTKKRGDENRDLSTNNQNQESMDYFDRLLDRIQNVTRENERLKIENEQLKREREESPQKKEVS